MNLLKISATSCSLVIDINLLTIVIILAFFIFIYYALPGLRNKLGKKSLQVDEVSLGIGNNTFKMSYCRKDQEIAYKLWVELSTRKIGIMFEEDYDVITEVYDSWYQFFRIARDLLEEIPASRLRYSSDLIDLTEKILNNGLRPHLTKWQAKFRRWYSMELKNQANSDKPPQQIQKEFPEYQALLQDILETNRHMIQYMEYMRQIAFEE